MAKDSIPQSVYVYDESDNRLQVEYPVNSAVHSFTYNDADRLVDRSLNGSVIETFDYDPDGNMIARVAGGVTTRYNWDSFNKLTSVSSGAVQKTYKYDAEGVRKSSDGGVRSYSSGSMSLADLRPTNSISWIQGHQLLGLVQGSDHFWYLTDGLSSVRMVVDASGNVVATTESDEFGREVSSSGSADLRQHSYTGGVGVRNEMGELGLLYARQRWYDPGLGRWLSEDPIGFAGGLNLHGYVGGNPVNAIDPEGLMTDEALGFRAENQGFGELPVELAVIAVTFLLAPELSVGMGMLSVARMVAAAGLRSEAVKWVIASTSFFAAAFWGIDTGLNPGRSRSSRGLYGLRRRRCRGLAMYGRPAAKEFDWGEILSGHKKGGARTVGAGAKQNAKDIFWNMTEAQIKRTVMEAWKNRELVRTIRSQGKQVYRGRSGQYEVEMWFDPKTRIVETAYPLGTAMPD